MESADRLFPDLPERESTPKNQGFSILCVFCASAVNNSGQEVLITYLENNFQSRKAMSA
jgi:hypothetical protein